MKKFFLDYWKYFLLILLVIILLVASFAIYFLWSNTSVFGPRNKQDIAKNNSSNSADKNFDLVSKTIQVPEKYKTGVFSVERKVNLPQDFEIKVFANGLGVARSLAFDDKNGIYVTDLGGNLFYLVDENSDGEADSTSTVISALRRPHGVVLYKNNLYVAEENQVNVFTNISGKNYSERKIIISSLPADEGHATRSLAIGPDEKLYVSIGSSCNVCEEKDERRASIVRYNLDGSGEEIFAKGLRNSVGIKFHEEKLWGVDNGRDQIGDDIPAEEVNIIEQGKHYGWPYCHTDREINPEFPDKESFCKNDTELPKYKMQAHTAPLGLDFFPNTYESLGIQNDLLIAQHGSWNRTTPVGYKLVKIKNADNSEEINFATGWLEENGKAWGRPVDVKFDKDGKIFVTDDVAGALYMIQFGK